jgi:hypothetical protein
VAVSLHPRCETIVFHSWWQYIESMCVLYIDIVIVIVDLGTICYFGDCYPSAMTLGGHLDYSHLQMTLAVPWPTYSMLVAVVFVGLDSSMCSYMFPSWCLIMPNVLLRCLSESRSRTGRKLVGKLDTCL